MQRFVAAGLVLMIPLLLSGCDALSFLLPNNVTVMFVNQGEFTVEAKVLVHNEQDTPEFLLSTVGEELDISIPAGGTNSLVRDCADLQVIQIDDADLRVLGGIGPEDSSEVLRDGDDFNCGSIITFTFNHSALITDFAITSSVQRR